MMEGASEEHYRDTRVQSFVKALETEPFHASAYIVCCVVDDGFGAGPQSVVQSRGKWVLTGGILLRTWYSMYLSSY